MGNSFRSKTSSAARSDGFSSEGLGNSFFAISDMNPRSNCDKSTCISVLLIGRPSPGWLVGLFCDPFVQFFQACDIGLS
jgi:hypothetical protein